MSTTQRLLELAGIRKDAGFFVRLEHDTESNDNFRKVIYTTKLTQLVLMSLKPGEEIGVETHSGGDQFIRIDKGQGKAIMGGGEYDMSDGDAVVIPSGVEHNIINTSDSEDLKIYAVYSPPEHKDGTVDKSKPNS